MVEKSKLHPFFSPSMKMSVFLVNVVVGFYEYDKNQLQTRRLDYGKQILRWKGQHNHGFLYQSVFPVITQAIGLYSMHT